MCDIRWVAAFLISSHLMGTGIRSRVVTLADCREYALGERPLRVGLAQQAAAVTLTCRAPAAVLLDGKAISWPAAAPLVIRSGAGSAWVRTQAGNARVRVCLLQPAQDADIEVSADGSPVGKYSSEIEVRAGPRGLSIVNLVPLETYLLGVVPAEMPASFPQEALKAQAIIARTYALYERGAHESEGFDLCAGVHCQVYRGADTAARTSEAVAATRKYVLAYNGVLAKAVYHSTCGGATEDAWRVWWGHLLPYLRGRPDGTDGLAGAGQGDVGQFLKAAKGWCQASSKYRWEVEMDWQAAQEKVLRNLPAVAYTDGRKPRKLLDLRVASRTPSGRVRQLVVVTDTGEESVWGDSIRWLFGSGRPGPGGLPGTLCQLSVRRHHSGAPAQVVISGGGWGHGIGLCQIGAAARARAGQSAREILAAYYTGVEVVKVE